MFLIEFAAIFVKTATIIHIYFREDCTFSSIPEPILSSSLQMSVDKTCVAIINQPNLEVSSNTNYSAANFIQLKSDQFFCTMWKCKILGAAMSSAEYMAIGNHPASHRKKFHAEQFSGLESEIF